MSEFLMDLFIDVGNTHTVFGIYKGNSNDLSGLVTINKTVDIKYIVNSIEDSLIEVRFSTNTIDTPDDMFNKIRNFLDFWGANFSNGKYEIGRCVVSSVVPQVNFVIEGFIEKYLALQDSFYFVEANKDLGINWNTDNYKEMGADRVADILGAMFLFNDNFIIIDFGTAITIDIIKDKSYVGGAILPGFLLNVKSLFSNTAKLPMVEIKPANKIYDNTTIGQIQIGCVDLVCKGINAVISECLKEYKYKVIITGGFSNMVKNIVINDYVIQKLQFIGMINYVNILKNKLKSR